MSFHSGLPWHLGLLSFFALSVLFFINFLGTVKNTKPYPCFAGDEIWRWEDAYVSKYFCKNGISNFRCYFVFGFWFPEYMLNLWSPAKGEKMSLWCLVLLACQPHCTEQTVEQGPRDISPLQTQLRSPELGSNPGHKLSFPWAHKICMCVYMCL